MFSTNTFRTNSGITYFVESCSTLGKDLRVIVTHPADELNPEGYKTLEKYSTFGDLFFHLKWVKAVPYSSITITLDGKKNTVTMEG